MLSRPVIAACMVTMAMAMMVMIVTPASVMAWPGMSGVKGANHPAPKKKAVDVNVDAVPLMMSDPVGPVVGPICTVGAHGTWPEMGGNSLDHPSISLSSAQSIVDHLFNVRVWIRSVSQYAAASTTRSCTSACVIPLAQ